MLKDFFKYLIISVVTGIVVLFLRGWIAQEDWFVKRFGSDKQKEALLNAPDNSSNLNKDKNKGSLTQHTNNKTDIKDSTLLTEINQIANKNNKVEKGSIDSSSKISSDTSSNTQKKSKFEIYKELARDGDPYAEYKLAYFYLNGIKTNKDLQKALKWYKKSANHNYLKAQYTLGQIYENGLFGLEKDLREAIKWYQKASNQGDKEAKRALERLKIAKVSTIDPPSTFKKEDISKEDTTALTDKLKRFISNYMQMSMYNRVEAYLNFFKFPLKNYFGEMMASKDFVRQKRAEYIRKWINRIYTIQNMEIVSQTKDKIVIKILYYWEINSLHKKLDGRNELLMNLIYQNGKFQITSIEQL